MFQKIIVGFDGSDPAVRALELACALSKLHQSEIHLVHTPEVLMTEFPTHEIAKHESAKVIDDATGIAAAMNVKLASTTIGESKPCDDIMTIANLYEGDLIITGRRGLSSVSGLFLGSTSQKLAQVAKCACMTVA